MLSVGSCSIATRDPTNRRDPSKDPPPAPRAAQITPYLDALLTGLSCEFHDQSHTPSSPSHGRHLLARSGLDEPTFVQCCYQARAVTRARGTIAKDARDRSAPGTKNRMPYVWTVLDDLLPCR